MTPVANFTFYGALQDFLKPAARGKPVVYTFSGKPAIKDAIEAIGIPHTEVAVILKHNSRATFLTPLQPNDELLVFPFDSQKSWPPGYMLASMPEKPYRFVLDVHLGTLAKALRMLGFDTLYNQKLLDAEISRISQSENRIVLTRDIGLLKQKIIEHGYWLRSQHTTTQLQEVISRYGLLQEIRPLIRCLVCNQLIMPVAKEAIAARLPPKTRLYFNEFYQCAPCNKVYWKGSHYEHMESVIRQIREG
ncbi:uncharacterized protein with PIN domain [Pontibacter aydingkolensis]|uniref:Mut7-C ubiquitin/RNAse domain-containing protein n=1 Tax=Pontibacter aydingkolensis TaxID=1911536 RepID=A0ABS7CYU8_9BACT|nr:Mut7-C ubiquitin/RNAse domain-containing protein [Pontibacter aydingkolensis]MBW7468687.1 Mut7-C ubiquitin/RNAse domain-containing protein [Pontibacter aydingkolensis]